MVYFLLPYTPFEPVGGVHTVFDYVMRLNELAGKNIAAVLADSKYLKSWLPSSYQKVTVFPTNKKLSSFDTLVIPEVIVEEAKRYPSVKRKLLVVLNWKYFEDNIKSYSLQQLGYSGILTNSEFSQKHLFSYAEDLPVWHVPHFINSNLFTPTIPISKRPKHSILIMNRKNTYHIPRILEFLKGFSHTVTILNNIAPAKMPAQYTNHQIFINLGYPEGFCRPAAEAMASGCLVVGFTGGGGTDFMVNDVNTLTAKDGNQVQLIEQLNRALHMDGAEKELFAKHAREMIVTRYAKHKQALGIALVFPKEIGKILSSVDIAKMYKPKINPSNKRTRARITTVKTTKTVELLAYQFFQERHKYEALTNSKFYKVWQGYCKTRDVVGRYFSHFKNTVKFSQA